MNSLVVFAAEEVSQPIFQPDWSVERLAQENNLDAKALLDQLAIIDTTATRAATLRELNISEEQANEAIRKLLVVTSEEKSKNWKLILLKFVLWWCVVIAAIILLKRYWVTPKRRTWLLAAAFTVFGIIMGSDPSPMGTVKDTIALFGKERIIFPPRLVAFTIFTLMVIVGNRLICGWGCQFGTLQDWLYQVSPVKKKIRIPFAVSNGIRITVFIAFTIVAIGLSYDFIGPVDPFKVFALQQLTLVSTAFIALLLLISLFFYRPWCTLACPFGMTGWLAEYISWFRVRWNQSKCIGCGACRRACPTGHTNYLLDGKMVKPDCYSCAACLAVCPVKALRYDYRSIDESVPNK
ncbi:MAG: yccM 2 [Firmicutes bacterium]|nr:yccM 2 [Bacillota bacterium]